MSNFTKRLIALVLLLSHLLTSCGHWEVGGCGKGEPHEHNGCKAPGQADHGRYVEDTPDTGGSLMTQEGFIAAFNRVCQIETRPIQQLPCWQSYFPTDSHTTGTSLSPIMPLQPHLSTSQLSLIPNQRPIHLHLPPLGNSNSLTHQFLSASTTGDMIGSLWNLGSTLTNYSHQTREIERYHEEAANRKIAEMRLQAEQSKREQEEYVRKLTMEEAKVEEKRRLAAKEQKVEEQKAREAHLQKLIERRQEVETGRTRVIKPENYFIVNSSTSNVKRTQESINKLRQRLTASSGTTGLASGEQGDVKYILQRIEKLSQKLKDNIADIKYFIEHPNSSVKYNSETLNLATQLLQDLSRQKEELRQLVSTKGTNLEDYIEITEPKEETSEELSAYKELALAINDPNGAMEWVVFATQQMKTFLEANGSATNKSESVKTQAELLATRVTEVLRMMQSKKIATTEAYFGADTSDYINLSIKEGVQKLKFIEEAIDHLQESLDYFCTQFAVSPKAESAPIITKESLKVTLNAAIDLLIPGSEVLKTILGTSPLPNTPEQWADLAISAGLDFVPLGKTLKIFIGPVNSIIHNKVKDFVVKLLKKRLSKSSTQVARAVTDIFKPAGKVVGKQLGNNPLIRSVSQEEAQNIIEQLMKAGAKQATNQPVNYKGIWYVLPGGGGFGIRTKSSLQSTKHGTKNTIDLKIDAMKELLEKVKF